MFDAYSDSSNDYVSASDETTRENVQQGDSHSAEVEKAEGILYSKHWFSHEVLRGAKSFWETKKILT